MPLVIEQRFPLGRYHATRWGQNPFEDRVGEWPPSPWRLLRALAARWFQYQREIGGDDTRVRDDLLRTLAGELPSFRLPALTWRGDGLRQYQPTALEYQFKYRKNSETGKNELEYSYRSVSSTLALDCYRVISSAESICWIWASCTLSQDSSRLLRELLRRIHYFGRGEAWTTMHVADIDGGIAPNCRLQAEGSSDLVPVLAHDPAQTLDIDLLLAPTDDERLRHRRIPPGTAWFQAVLPARPKVTGTRRARRGVAFRQAYRYSLHSTVLPTITETLSVAEAARYRLMGIQGRLTARDGANGRSTVFSGKDESGERLKDHSHAYYLPTDEDGDGRIDHLTVFAAGGFSPDEQRALDLLRDLRTGRPMEARYPLRLLMLGMGTSGEYPPGPLRPSAVWESATPYLASRYAKTEGRNRINLASPAACAAFLASDIRGLIAAVRPDLSESGAQLVSVEPLWENRVFTVAGRWRPIQFKRFRRKAGDDGGRRLAGSFRLTFDRPVRGPIALGWSSHFGMGLFVPTSAGLG